MPKQTHLFSSTTTTNFCCFTIAVQRRTENDYIRVKRISPHSFRLSIRPVADRRHCLLLAD
jgi:hypothetical protein